MAYDTLGMSTMFYGLRARLAAIWSTPATWRRARRTGRGRRRVRLGDLGAVSVRVVPSRRGRALPGRRADASPPSATWIGSACTRSAGWPPRTCTAGGGPKRAHGALEVLARPGLEQRAGEGAAHAGPPGGAPRRRRGAVERAWTRRCSSPAHRTNFASSDRCVRPAPKPCALGGDADGIARRGRHGVPGRAPEAARVARRRAGVLALARRRARSAAGLGRRPVRAPDRWRLARRRRRVAPPGLPVRGSARAGRRRLRGPATGAG